MAPRRSRLPLCLCLCLCALLGCASPQRFPLREPMLRDPDQRPFFPPPESYESPFMWDGADQMVFRPIARFFAVDPAGPAVNVNAFDEVPDSSWFVNRLGTHTLSAEEVIRGSCGEHVLTTDMPDGSWIIDKGKPNGANPGFRVNIPGLGKFMLKADPAGEPDRATGATAIASRIYHAVGYHAPCDSVVYFHPRLLRLEPNLTFTDNSDVTRPFDQAALDRLLAGASQRDGLVRMGASRWLPGKTLGPYRYEGTRDGDPNDVVPHEDRRDLRGARLLAAWLNHFDTREQNSMDVFMPLREDDDDSPGHVRHYILDLGDCFGSVWAEDGISKRLGFAHYLDFPYLFADLGTLGIIERPWDRARRNAGIFNYFSARDFVPEDWRGGYPNPAFLRMTEADGAWMARILAQFDATLVTAAVSVGRYDPVSTRYLEQTLMARRHAILKRYLTRLSPISKLRVEGGRLCGVDLARAQRVVPDDGRGFAARAYTGEDDDEYLPLRVEARSGGHVCVELPRPSGGDAPRYLVVGIWSDHAEGWLRAHLYDLGPQGFRLVGIERT
jgi:hypothetical protein